jgi:hypothetical protein
MPLNAEQTKILTKNLRVLADKLEAGSTVEKEKPLIRDTAVALLDGVGASAMVKSMLLAFLK